MSKAKAVSIAFAMLMAAAPPVLPPVQAQSAAEERCLDAKIATFRRIEGPDREINFDVLEEWRGECRSAPATKLPAAKPSARLDTAGIARMAEAGVSLFAMPALEIRFREIMAEGRALSAVEMPQGLPITRTDGKRAMTLICRDAACRNNTSLVVDLASGQAVVCEKWNSGPGDSDKPTTWYGLNGPPVLRRELSNCPDRIEAVPAAMFASTPTRAPVAAPLIRVPVAGSAERKAMLDAIRPKVEAELGQPLEFRVRTLRVSGNFGFAVLDPQRPGGGRIVPGETPMGRRMIADMGSLDIFDCCHTEAILERTAKGWVVLDYGVGATDVWYDGWNKKPLPAALLRF